MNQKLTRQAIAELEAEYPPTVTVERFGRWTYFVNLTHGLTDVDGWHVFGEKRARKLARRKLNRYNRRRARVEEFGRQVIR